jgi:CRP-like cAMP-binding protein
MSIPARPDAEAVLAETFACPPAVATAINGKAHLRDYPAKAVIVACDSVFDAVHVMVAGNARMQAFGLDGRLVAVEDYSRGDLFGENGLFETERAAHDIAAMVPSCAAAIGNTAFLDLMANYNCVALAVSRRLVARLSRITRRMVEGATLSANGRIHAEILRQAQAGTAMTISPPPVLSQLALTVHSTRETVSRAISALEKRGIIRRDGQGLTVVAPHRLEELIF